MKAVLAAGLNLSKQLDLIQLVIAVRIRAENAALRGGAGADA